MIQIDMNIPKTCDDCPFHIYHSDKNYVCVATPLFYPMNLANYKDGRKDFCPLIEVKQVPKKGHWILTDVEGDRVWHCNCSECGKDPQDYVYGSENWWLIKSKLPKFCPSCGSNNREVEE